LMFLSVDFSSCSIDLMLLPIDFTSCSIVLMFLPINFPSCSIVLMFLPTDFPFCSIDLKPHTRMTEQIILHLEQFLMFYPLPAAGLLHQAVRKSAGNNDLF